MQVDGKCFCGAVTYQAEINPDRVLICHCTDCQNHSGSAYRVVAGIQGDARTVGAGTGFFGLRVGTIAQRQELIPRARVWTRSALAWSSDLTDIKTFAEQPDLDALENLLEH